MKKFLLLSLVSAMTWCGMSAATSEVLSGKIMPGIAMSEQLKEQVKTLPGAVRSHSLVHMPSMQISEDALSNLPLVTEVAGGEKTEYSRNTIFFGLGFYGELYSSVDFGYIEEVVATPDGKVYFKNPYSGMDTDSYLVGESEGDKVVVSFPQKIYSETYPDWENDPEGILMKTDNYYAFKMIYENDGTTSRMSLDLTDPSVTFVKTETGYALEGDSFIGMMLERVVTDETTGEEQSELMWTGFADSGVVLQTVTDVPATLPDGIEMDRWILSSGGNDKFVNVAFDGDDVYVAGILSDLPDALVVGKIDGDRIMFSGAQFFGADYRIEHYTYFVPASISEGDAESEEPYIFCYEDKLIFDYDRESKVISCPDDMGIAVSTIPQSVFLVEGYVSPVIKWQDFATPMTPQNPEIYNYVFFDDYGYGAIAYNIPVLATDGRMLDISNLYYNVFLDNDIMTFYPDEYPGFEEPTIDIQAGYEDLMSIYYVFGEYEAIVYSQGFDRIGLRSFYINEDGSKTYSDIVYNDGSVVSGIDEALGDTEPVKVEYYTLGGMKIEKPIDGSVVIKRIWHSDGSVSANKIIIKND